MVYYRGLNNFQHYFVPYCNYIVYGAPKPYSNHYGRYMKAGQSLGNESSLGLRGLRFRVSGLGV